MTFSSVLISLRPSDVEPSVSVVSVCQPSNYVVPANLIAQGMVQQMQQQCQNDLIGDHTELGTGTSGEQYENQCCTRTRRETTKKTTAEGKHAQNNEDMFRDTG